MNEITEPDLRNIIIQAVQEYGSQKALAAAKKISATYLNEIVNRDKPISDTVARKFGYRLVKKYIKKGSEV
jgi:hypothetical protein